MFHRELGLRLVQRWSNGKQVNAPISALPDLAVGAHQSTVRYPGIEVDDALELAEHAEV
jgi:hypothetical protein